MVRVGIIGILNAFLTKMTRDDGVSVAAVSGGRNSPAPVRVVQARIGPQFIRPGGCRYPAVGFLLRTGHRRGRLHLYLRDGRRGRFPIIRGSRDVCCAGEM